MIPVFTVIIIQVPAGCYDVSEQTVAGMITIMRDYYSKYVPETHYTGCKKRV